MAAAYLITSWLIVQVVGVLTEPLSLPDVLDTIVVVLLAIGFPVVLVAAWIYDITPEGIRMTGDDSGAKEAGARQRLTIVVIGLLIAAVGLMALDNYVLAPSSERSVDVTRVAVLPCTDLSPDPTQSFFAAGIHAELINRLSLLGALEVISQTSVLRYSDGRTPISEVATELGVSAVMECFVRYSGDRALLSVQLIDGASDTGLWTGSYQADMADLHSLFQIQAEIGMNVANALHVAFLETERELLERPLTDSREAYELWLAASEENPAAGGGPRAVELLEQALAIDPEFAEAWSTKSRAQATMYIARPDREALLVEALDAAERSILLAPGKADGYLARAQIRAIRHDWLGAERDLQAASDRGSTRADAPVLLLLSAGYLEQARDAVERALDSDPLNGNLHYWLILVHEMLANTEAADAAYAQGSRLFATGPWLGNFAIEWLRLGRGEVGPGYPLLSSLPAALSDLPDWIEDPDSALALLKRETSEEDDLTPVGFLALAIWAAYFGDSEYTVQLLKEAVGESGSGTLMQQVWLPVFDDVRQSPEFKGLMRDIGLVDYWRSRGWPDLCRPLGGEDFVCS